MSNHDLNSEFKENYRYAHDFWGSFSEAARIYTLAASGYTWSEAEMRELAKEGREPIEFNLMRRSLQFFSGYLRDNLNSIVISPVEGSDQKTADQFTKLQYYVWEKGEGYSTFLDSADECMKSGLALCGIEMDYSKDFINGDLRFYKRTYNSFYLDPTFEHIDLRDCSFAITRDLVSRDIIKQLIPFVDPKDIDQITTAFRDDKFLNYHPNFTALSRNKNLVAYDQYYKRITKKRKFLVDMDNTFYKDITDLSEEEIAKLKTGIYRLGKMREEEQELGTEKNKLPPNIEIRTVNRDYVELNIMLNGMNVYTGEDKTGINRTFPFVPLVCYAEPSIWIPAKRFQGIASTMYSIQRQFNKRHMKIFDMMDSDIATGWKYMIGSVSDPTDLQQSGQNKIIGIDPENAPEGMNSVQQLQGGSANPALIEYQKILDQLSLTLSTVNESVLGVDDKGNTQVSGKLAQVRIAQGLTSNRKLFDNIELSQKILGGLIIDAIQATYPPSKVMRILAEEPTQQFYEKEFEQYDAIIKQGIRSASQRDAYYYELVNLKRDGIVDVPQQSIIKALSIAGLSDLEDDIAAKDQQQQQQQQQALKAQNDFLVASTEEKTALAQERRGRVISNIALAEERASQGEENRATAALDKAKTITEIAKMGDERIMKVLAFVESLEQREVEDRELAVDTIYRKANQINVETEGTPENEQYQEAKKSVNQSPTTGNNLI